MPDQHLPPGAGVLIYTRVSPRPEGEDGELSVESQVAELQALAARSGWAVLGTFTDHLVSGSTDDRPAFQQLIATATSDSRVQGVLVWRFSRFARDDDASIYWKAVLGRAGVKVVSYKEPLPDLGGWERVIERVIEIQDAQMLRQTREDVKRGHRFLVQQGLSAGGRIPVGYVGRKVQRGTRRDGSPRYNTTLEPDPERAGDVLGAFQMLAAGATYPAINARYRLVTDSNVLHYIFRNPVYAGAQAYEDLVNWDAHEAIVPRALWDRAQAILDARRKPANRARGGGARGPGYLLSGLAVCGWCGLPVTGTAVCRGLYRYYRCSGKCRLRDAEPCPLPYVRQADLEGAVLEAIREEILVPAHIADLVREVNARLAGDIAAHEARRARLTAELKGVDRKVANIVGAIEELGVRAGDVAGRLAELNDRRALVVSQLAALEAQAQWARPLSVSEADVVALVEDLDHTLATAPMPERRALLRSFIERVVVFPEYVRIEYQPPGLLA